MYNRIAVTQSDSVNRDGSKFTLGALFSSVWDNWDNIVPILFQHDAHQPIGWSRPLGLHLEPGTARVVAILSLLESDDDWNEFKDEYRGYLAERVQRRHGSDEEELRERLSGHLEGDEELLDLSSAALVGEGLARRVFPKIFKQENKYSLVPLSELNEVRPGVYQNGDLVLYAHRFFRRNLSRLNSLNQELLRELMSLNDRTVEIGIRLDPDAVGLAETVMRPVEMEYWWGPKFDDDLTNIDAGVTQHRADERQRKLHGLHKTEFWWKLQENSKRDRTERVLEVEELVDEKTCGYPDSEFECRYAHSILDEESGQIEHLDGSVRGYTVESYVERLDVDLKSAGKRTDKTKLWQVDGDISKQNWKTLLHHHFRNNPLVGEYLGADSESESSFEAEVDQQKTGAASIRNYVPHTMDAGDGLRFFLNINQSEHEVCCDRPRIVPVEMFSFSDESCWVVDAELLELEKLLRRNDIEPKYSRCLRRYSVKDMYTEFPLLLHETKSSLEQTVHCFRQLVEKWSDHGDDRVVVGRFGLCEGDMEIRCSIIGHVSDFSDWPENIQLVPTHTDYESVQRWTNQVYDHLDGFPSANNNPPLVEVTEECGLVLNRQEAFRVEPYWDESRECLMFRTKLDEESEIYQLMSEGHIRPEAAFLIDEVTCSKCEDDYEQCLCSKVLDRDVVCHIEDLQFVNMYWSDRSAIIQ